MMEQETLNIAVGYAPEATTENAGQIRTALLMGFIQLSQKYPASRIEPEMARMALQWIPPDEHAIIDLDGLRGRLLAPRVAMRDEKGWLIHDAMPVLGEGTHIGKFLEAFGLEVHIGSMENENDAFATRYHEEGLDHCLDWNPIYPVGNGWILIEIYMGEDDCYSLFVRCAYAAEKEREERDRAARRALRGTIRENAPVNSIDV